MVSEGYVLEKHPTLAREDLVYSAFAFGSSSLPTLAKHAVLT